MSTSSGQSAGGGGGTPIPFPGTDAVHQQVLDTVHRVMGEDLASAAASNENDNDAGAGRDRTEDASPSPRAAVTAAREQAPAVGAAAEQGVAKVAATARASARDVAAETTQQAGKLLSQARTEVLGQADAAQRRVTGGLRTAAGDLSELANGHGGSGVAADLTGQAAARVRQAAGWLEDRQPAEVLAEIGSFARRQPVMFLAAAATAGVLAGRLTRALTARKQSGQLSRARAGVADGNAGGEPGIQT